MLDQALAHSIPESVEWKREIFPPHPKVRGESTYYIQVDSPTRPEEQKLALELRYDGDIQVEYHMKGDRGSPYETFFPILAGRELIVIKGIAEFVKAIVAEEIVLSYWTGFFKGGRRFVEPKSLEKSDRRKLSWVTSWRGTFDWRSSAK